MREFDEETRYLKISALFNLALLSNSALEAVHYSRQAQSMLASRRLRRFLPIPAMTLDPRPGPAIRATR